MKGNFVENKEIDQTGIYFGKVMKKKEYFDWMRSSYASQSMKPALKEIKTIDFWKNIVRKRK